MSRADHGGQVLGPEHRAVEPVSLRYVDAEFFTASVTDVAMWQTEALSQYQALVEELRETAFWDRYFADEQIIPSVEDAFASYYGVAGF